MTNQLRATRSLRARRPTARRSRRYGLFVLLVSWLLAATSTIRSADDPPANEPPANSADARHKTGVLIRFEGTITPLTERYLLRKLDQARQLRATLIVVEIDSPGGMMVPSLEIAAKLRDTAWARTVAFVPREALSGGAIVALGCDDIVMNGQAKLGDAGPIYQSENGLFQHAPEKIRSHLARHVRDLAEAKQRSPALAEAMVDKDLVVFRCRNRATGEEAFLSEHEINSHIRPDDWERLAPILESQGTNFLEVNGQRAVELKLARATAADREELRRLYKLDAPWIVLESTAKDVTVSILNHPLITALLIIVGLVAIFIELCSPGLGFGGLVALLCFALFFWSRFLGGTSGWLEVVLFVVGAVFLGVELFVLPGFGVAGVSGILLMVVSLLMASQDFIVPHTHQELITFSRSLVVLVGSIVTFLIVAMFAGRHMRGIPIFRRLVLAAPLDRVTGDEDAGKKWFDPSGKPLGDVPHPDACVSVGDWGVAKTALRPAGKARMGNSIIDVVADGAFIDAGRQVRVTEIQGSRVVVVEVPE